MKIQNVFFLLLMLAVQSLSANTNDDEFSLGESALTSNTNCTLPPPSELNVTSIQSEWVTVTWPSVPGAAQYRLSVQDGSNGGILGTPVFVPGNANTATLSLVGNSGTANVRIWSVCDDGSWDPTQYRSTPDFGVPIIELVATGFTQPGVPRNYMTMGYESNNGTPIKWNGGSDYFIVSYGNQNRYFVSTVMPGGPGGNDIVFIKIGGNEEDEEGNGGQKIVLTEHPDKVSMYVRYRANTSTNYSQAPIVAEVMADRTTPNSPNGILFKSTAYQDPNCIIKKLVYEESQGKMQLQKNVAESESDFLEDRSNPLTSSPQLSARPNPFRDALTVQIPEAKAENARMMHLYDLLGARRISYQVPANQTECTLNTSLLTPGVYFLHIETDGKMESIKLLKTQ